MLDAVPLEYVLRLVEDDTAALRPLHLGNTPKSRLLRELQWYETPWLLDGSREMFFARRL